MFDAPTDLEIIARHYINERVSRARNATRRRDR